VLDVRQGNWNGLFPDSTQAPYQLERCSMSDLVFLLCRVLAFIALTGIGSILLGIAIGKIEV